MHRLGKPTFRKHAAGVSKTLFLLVSVIIVLIAICGCSETLSPPKDQPFSRFIVYFNNDDLAKNTMVCDAVFPVPRSSSSITNVAAAALEALFRGPTAEERSQGYRSFFSVRTAGLLKRLKIRSGTAYVDLHDRRQELTGATSSCGRAEFFTQIQRTLGQFPAIERIIFAIDGQPRVFYDWMELECDQTNDNCALPSVSM
jgi:spore germination protein GerM